MASTSKHDKYTYLGVVIDCQLKWKDQVKAVLGKLKRSLFMMKHISPFISAAALRTMYNAIFLPHITYACTAWEAAPDQDLQKIQTMQNRAGKLILNAPYRTPTTEVLSRLGWKDIKATHQYSNAVLVYKALNSNLPPYMRQMFVYCRDQSSFGFIADGSSGNGPEEDKRPVPASLSEPETNVL
ncbi:uncharacterized protein LOC144883706 [Branchiostoma floridae x Branchiostoma japonicum]